MERLRTISGPLGRRLRDALAAIRRSGLPNHFTPARLVAGVIVIAAAGLVVAQFLDYRAVVVSTDTYDPGTAGVAPPPEIAVETTGSAHSYLLLAIAPLTGLLLFATLRGRWQLSRLIVPLGLVVLAVSILIDLPAARDVAEYEQAYTGVDYSLKAGIWLQIAAGAVLSVAPLFLASSLRRTRPAAARRRRPAPAPVTPGKAGA